MSEERFKATYDDVLLAEIGQPAYADLTPEEIADALNAKTVPGPDLPSVRISDVLVILRESGEWYAVIAAAQITQDTSPGARAAYDLYLDPRETLIDLNHPRSQLMLADLVQRGLVAQASADAALALHKTTKPWRQSVLGMDGILTAADIYRAKGLEQPGEMIDG